MRRSIKYMTSLLIVFFFGTQFAFAGDAPPPSFFSNTLAVLLVSIMIVLLIVIGVLASILVGAADIRVRKRKAATAAKQAAMLLLFLLSTSAASFAQGDTPAPTASAPSMIGGLSTSTFYLMVSILFLELVVIFGLLINIRFLIRREQEKEVVVEVKPEVVKQRKPNWWDRINRFRPVSQEAELDLGHEYDGIRELNNRLPPWWLYGFYISILFAGIYLWRFHVSHTGPSSKEEYEISVARANLRVQEYLKKKGESVDENTVAQLTDAADLEAGKAIFMDPSKCPACHGADGGGTIGPNLTDTYWLYGGGIKDVFKTIKYGTNKGMKSWKDDLSPKQIAQVASYVRSLQGTHPANPKAPQGELYEEIKETKPAADSTTGTVKK